MGWWGWAGPANIYLFNIHTEEMGSICESGNVICEQQEQHWGAWRRFSRWFGGG